ncbi:Uncharacterized protein PECH_006973 [Penicillium ucsense]|uniref:Spindle assembly checkpoint component MAD1 n=1 Tax=Penicillium ucsense TaxID=2839758 RepID=A0A8J8WKJ7_9EURO|nr:Uncharacterized protein PECM_005055 [Penicillium ucsense]KAF7739011.1 Uncharacterized protein PECH_006973 [Penicillium ucsense]
METRQSARKRRNSATANAPTFSPISHRTRNGKRGDNTCNAPETTTASTPKKARKRVRFSDPGPRLLEPSAGSTGLTPAMKRSFCLDSDRGPSKSRESTPARHRAQRRRSAPLPQRRSSFDLAKPWDEAISEKRIQFTPLRQILDVRTQRRIKRFGLSDEINSIQREKRQSAVHEKTLEALRQERDALQSELEYLKQRVSPASISNVCAADIPGDENNTVARSRSAHSPELSSLSDDEDMLSLHDNAFIESTSPDPRDMRRCRMQSPLATPASDDGVLETSSCARTLQFNADTESRTLDVDLQLARNEKRDLFDACRQHLSAFDDPEFSDSLRGSSLSPDFVDNLTKALTDLLSRASDATRSLEGITQTCCALGFAGLSSEDILEDMQSHFRAARLELERIVPGETANIGLGDGKATLGALVQRVRTLASDLDSERAYYYGSLGREKALRGQFDNLLHRYEAAASKIKNLEETIASSAGDMLHTRMRLQELESEDQEKSLGIDRLNIALDKYHEDVKGLEEMVSNLETANANTKRKYKKIIADLEAQVKHEREQRAAVESAASDNALRIRQLEETIEQNQRRAQDLAIQMQTLENDHHSAIEALEQRTLSGIQTHEKETGALNVQISDLTTSLDEARSEARRLQQVNTELEKQLQLETEARDDLLDKWAIEQARSFAFMKETVNSERRRGKVRAANWGLRSDDLMSDAPSVMDSEPITPVSMTRFVDVELGRGKDRRRVDSGIGLYPEDDIPDRERLEDC